MSEPRSWPAGRPIADDEALAAACTGCGQAWRVHRDLAGGRLACDCGAWVDIPRPASSALLPLHAEPAGALALLDPGEERHLPATHHEVDELATPVRVEQVQRFTGRVVLELVALVGAFLLPPMVFEFSFSAPRSGLLMPVASLASGLLVLVIGAFTQGVAFSGLRGARPLRFLEALVAVLPFLAVAMLFQLAFQHWMPDLDDPFAELRDRLGLGMTLFVVAFCPGLFEELAFRGVLHARMRQLFGPPGLAITAAAFALAHGAQPFLLVHFAIGLYLSWLRDRSGSLLPGMLTHMVYNASVILLVT